MIEGIKDLDHRENKLNIEVNDELLTNPLERGFKLVEYCKENDIKILEFDFKNINEFPILFKGLIDYINIIIQNEKIDLKIKFINVKRKHKIYL